MNLLDKIAAVTIQADTRISEEDRQFCQLHQQAYIEALSALSDLKMQWEVLYDSQRDILGPISDGRYDSTRYIDMQGVSLTGFSDKIEMLPKLFIKSIVQYFNKKYHVSVSDENIIRHFVPESPKYTWEESRIREYHLKMQEMALQYEDILEQIFVELGGRTFEERSLDEIRERCHKAAWNPYSNEAKYQVKKDTIQFDGYFCSYRGWLSHNSWELETDMQHILRGVAHFETRQTMTLPHIISFLISSNGKEESTYDLNLEKVVRIRFFKNNRVDIKFAGKEYAHQFAEQYLGLVA